MSRQTDGRREGRTGPAMCRGGVDIATTWMQEARLQNEAICEAHEAQRAHCHGVSLGTRSPECERADARLVDRIVLELRGDLALPRLENIL